jgi:hypothetical protein
LSAARLCLFLLLLFLICQKALFRRVLADGFSFEPSYFAARERSRGFEVFDCRDWR